MEQQADVVVVGGGLCGLTAATVLARAGRQVVLCDGALDMGGRARSREDRGFIFNQGPHALYRRGQARRVLDDLGVRYSGRVPAGPAFALREGRLHSLPVGLASLLTTTLVDARDKLELARLLARLKHLETAPLQAVTVSDWLDTAMARPRVRDLFRMLVRLTSYAHDPDRHSAGAAVAQLQGALGSVLYLDGGWQTLVEGLRAAAKTAGVRLHAGTRVRAVAVRRGGVDGVTMVSGTHVTAPAVILAGSPGDAAALLDGPGHDVLARWAEAAHPILASCLDVALRATPRPDRPLVLGVDRPTYVSVHSASAHLAPPGHGLIQAILYGGSHEPAAARAELEALLDTAQPGWREAVLAVRFMPRMVVSHALPLAATGGLGGRPGPAVPGVPGLRVAGDWVGPVGLLADASMASAVAAAQDVLSASADKPSRPRLAATA